MVRTRSSFDNAQVDGGVEPTPDNVLFAVWLISRKTTQLLDSALEPAGLNADEFAIYSVLRERPVTPTELAGWMSAPVTSVSSYVKRFESRGHVERETNPDDRRSYRLRLTDDGLEAHRLAAECFRPVLADVEEAVGRSLEAVTRALTSVSRALHEVQSA
jgi:DNA-binding MarR family transcriptional regulator